MRAIDVEIAAADKWPASLSAATARHTAGPQVPAISRHHLGLRQGMHACRSVFKDRSTKESEDVCMRVRMKAIDCVARDNER